MEAQVFPWNLNEDHNTNFTAIFKIPSGFYLHVYQPQCTWPKGARSMGAPDHNMNMNEA
jgi:hypothetical protein